MTVSAHRSIRVTAVMLAVAALALALYPNAPVPDRSLPTIFIGSGLTVPAAMAQPSVASLPPLFGGDALPDATNFSSMEVAQEAAGDQVPPAARERNAPPAALPTLVGIAGRLPDDAEVLLRLADGSTATLAVGESIAGMRLLAVGADRAEFVRNGRSIVMRMDGN